MMQTWKPWDGTPFEAEYHRLHDKIDRLTASRNDLARALRDCLSAMDMWRDAQKVAARALEEMSE